MNKAAIAAYFHNIAPDWEYWQARNRYYHSTLNESIQDMVPTGMDVLELGCGTGDLLSMLKPRRGIGINFGQALTDLAATKYPGLEFRNAKVDRLPDLEGFKPDVIVMNNMLDYVYDIWELLDQLHPLFTPGTLLIMTTNNPLWAPILRLASRFRLRFPESPRNFITNRDIQGVVEAKGFAVVEQSIKLPVPIYIPLASALINTVIPEIPVIRLLGSVQFLTARLLTTRKQLSLSVVIPCHNEEDNIVECIERIPMLGVNLEILIVDDGSRDATRQRVQTLMSHRPNLRLIPCDRNQGKAAAVREGFLTARNEVIIILDADMAVPPEELPKFFEPLQDGRCDFVNGIRFVYPMEGKAMKTLNFVGNKIFCFLMSWILRQRISDTLCGTKALLRKDYLRMHWREDDKWGDFGLLFEAARRKLRILEIPVHYHERKAGNSKMRAFREGVVFLRACARGWIRLRFPSRNTSEKAAERNSLWRELHPLRAESAA